MCVCVDLRVLCEFYFNVCVNGVIPWASSNLINNGNVIPTYRIYSKRIE